MSSDIKLDGDFTVVEGSALIAKTWDIMLDAPDRRANTDGLRRALVHDFNDGLTINFAEDYPGGVTIAGRTNLATISANSKLEIKPPAQPAQQPSEQSSGVQVVETFPNRPWSQPFEHLSELINVFADIEQSQNKPTTILAVEIRRLRQAVLELNERLKRLENS